MSQRTTGAKLFYHCKETTGSDSKTNLITNNPTIQLLTGGPGQGHSGPWGAGVRPSMDSAEDTVYYWLIVARDAYDWHVSTRIRCIGLKTHSHFLS